MKEAALPGFLWLSHDHDGLHARRGISCGAFRTGFRHVRDVQMALWLHMLQDCTAGSETPSWNVAAEVRLRRVERLSRDHGHGDLPGGDTGRGRCVKVTVKPVLRWP